MCILVMVLLAHVDVMRLNNMCVQSQLEDQNTRITALESKHNTPEDIAAVQAAPKAELATLQAKLAMIETYLFGAGGVPDVPRDKSNIMVVKS